MVNEEEPEEDRFRAFKEHLYTALRSKEELYDLRKVDMVYSLHKSIIYQF